MQTDVILDKESKASFLPLVSNKELEMIVFVSFSRKNSLLRESSERLAIATQQVSKADNFM